MAVLVLICRLPLPFCGSGVVAVIRLGLTAFALIVLARSLPSSLCRTHIVLVVILILILINTDNGFARPRCPTNGKIAVGVAIIADRYR